MDKLFINKFYLMLMALLEAVLFWWFLYRLIVDELVFRKLLISVPFGLVILFWPIFYESFFADKFRQQKKHLLLKALHYCVLPYGFLFVFEYYIFDFSLFTFLLSSFVLALFLYINHLVVFLYISLGYKALRRFYTGKYKHPVEEIRAVMFLDLNDSTNISEKIGHKQYLSLLNDFFSDLSQYVPVYKGEIYKYVGDEMIILWEEAAVKKGNPFLCFLEMDQKISEKQDYYHQKYNQQISFKAGLNMGTVFVGEVGTYRKEIAFIGDTMNIAARLRDECNPLDYSLIYNANLHDYNRHSNKSVYLGEMTLKGKTEQIPVYGLKGWHS